MTDPIASLRASLPHPDKPTSYPRPEITHEEAAKYTKVAAKLNAIRDNRLRMVYLATIVVENARLLKEVNEHRAARGLELLPVYDPEAK